MRRVITFTCHPDNRDLLGGRVFEEGQPADAADFLQAILHYLQNLSPLVDTLARGSQAERDMLLEACAFLGETVARTCRTAKFERKTCANCQNAKTYASPGNLCMLTDMWRESDWDAIPDRDSQVELSESQKTALSNQRRALTPTEKLPKKPTLKYIQREVKEAFTGEETTWTKTCDHCHQQTEHVYSTSMQLQDDTIPEYFLASFGGACPTAYRESPMHVNAVINGRNTPFTLTSVIDFF